MIRVSRVNREFYESEVELHDKTLTSEEDIAEAIRNEEYDTITDELIQTIGIDFKSFALMETDEDGDEDYGEAIDL